MPEGKDERAPEPPSVDIDHLPKKKNVFPTPSSSVSQGRSLPPEHAKNIADDLSVTTRITSSQHPDFSPDHFSSDIEGKLDDDASVYEWEVGQRRRFIIFLVLGSTFFILGILLAYWALFL
jgi:hypothetical protein